MRPERVTAPVLALLLLMAAGQASAQELELPDLALQGIAFDALVRGTDSPLDPTGTEVTVGGRRYQGTPEDDGSLRFSGLIAERSGRVEVALQVRGTRVTAVPLRVLPAWVSIIPPVLAIAIALMFKQVIPALFLGLTVGSITLAGFTPRGVLMGTLDTFRYFVHEAVTDPDQASIILFSLMIGGMVGIVIKNGGMQGVVNHIVVWATSPRRGQMTAATLGLVIFFDDYANTLVVGNTMRKVTDSLRISREKLAYIVDSTAAPVSCVALVTTWIGYEVGLIGDAVSKIDGLDVSPYSIFLNSIPYSFYPVLTIFFVFVVAYLGRDFGPMHAAEVRARSTGAVLGPGAQIDEAAGGEAPELRIKEGKPVRAINAMLPIGVMIVSVLGGLYVTGSGDSLQDIVGSADSYTALMWGSLLGVLTAAGLTLAQRILTMNEIVDAWYAGLKSMLYAMIILILAWSLSSVSEGLHTADFLVSALSDSLVPGVVPALVFVLAAATAFATGSSWATMGILMPLVIPLVWAVLNNGAADVGHHVLYSTVASVLAGAVLGDHCSPISDTTILSSMASGCDHIEHVRTQMPYALTVGAVSVLLGELPTAFGMPWWIATLGGAAVLFAVIRYLGRPVDTQAA